MGAVLVIAPRAGSWLTPDHFQNPFRDHDG
jgi:hypothetical protein